MLRGWVPGRDPKGRRKVSILQAVLLLPASLSFQKFFVFFLQWREFTEVVRVDYSLVNTRVTS